MKSKVKQRRRSLVLIAGWGGLLLYAGAFSPLGLEAAALIGSFDRAHQVNLRAGTQGPQLVLHHHGGCPAHRHGWIARALVIFARPASAADPDHVIQFSAADNRLQAPQLAAPRPVTFAPPDIMLVEAVCCFAGGTHPAPLPFHPPPDQQACRLHLRSRVLLI